MASQWDLIGDLIPDDHARQVQSTYYVEQVMTSEQKPSLVVDLGCGLGRTARLFRRFDPSVKWLGIDISDSPESLAREATEGIVLYDGEHLPLADNSIPLIYCHQVLEHVRRPWITLAEVERVLQPGGLFIGSTSQFEPYHSYSVWGYTLFGFRLLIEGVNLQVEELRPGIDGVTLINRAYNGRRPEDSKWFGEESPVNQEIDKWGKSTRRGAKLVNNRKLEFCGQFAFKVRKPL
ncbi:MAG TPA: class I SAM-dependent methyltransferase [Actinobacteria bacterium]|nr:class I SAM-dependent methyltransferase [Actinomycetota bacterium]HCK79195.1 class I SAM-dependent methyltransferase [Actinomycetota bacterium]